MKYNKVLSLHFLCCVLLLVISCSTISVSDSVADANPRGPKPHNIILFIGDGMGPDQVASAVANAYGQQLDEQGEPRKLSFEEFPVYGYITTFSANSFVTDSAAAGTALACGVKTDNGVLGMDINGQPVQSTAEIAKQKGKAVGIMSSVGLNHATPAAFYAHVSGRGSYDEILEQFFQNQSADILIGGGFYYDAWTTDTIRTRADETGYTVISCSNIDEFNPTDLNGKKVFAYFDVNNNKQLDYEATRSPDNPEPHLSDLVVTTVNLLSRDRDGFFLMVESGSIDWACHGNKALESDGEVMELHKTVQRTVEFLRKKNLLHKTLIVVTADHETGGLGLNGPYKKVLLPDDEPEIGWTSTNHTAACVPVWAIGPGSALFSGKHDNTSIHHNMVLLMK